ncbi:MAG: dihydroneopterin aldolase [Hyphomicrobiales bacterium]
MMTKLAEPARKAQIANALNRIRHVFIRDLEIKAMLGIYEHEKIYPQTILVNIDLAVPESAKPINDDHNNVVCYASVVNEIKAIVAEGHVHLVETLAELIAQKCLEDDRVLSARVRIEKPDAVEEAASVGIEIERTR